MKHFRSIIGAVAFALLTMGFMPTQTFTVNDASTYGVGTILIDGPNKASSSIGVPSPGTYATSIDFTPFDVVINGQTVAYPAAALVTLPNSQQRISYHYTSTHHHGNMDYPWKHKRPSRNLLEVIWEDYSLDGPLLDEVVSLVDPPHDQVTAIRLRVQAGTDADEPEAPKNKS